VDTKKLKDFQSYVREVGDLNENQAMIAEADQNRDNPIMVAYRMTCEAKVDGVCEFLETLVENNVKFLVFAHHFTMLDALEDYATKHKVGYIRIDGKKSAEARHESVTQFQTKTEVRMAILSITAASVGITLTAASCVVFAELTWTPSLMMQAEDRTHRIGQKNSVNIYYLHGSGTLDEYIFKILQEKALVTTGVTDGLKANM
jgi:SWI/SNF-related matrix-associated actin-dependent regulator of chromatin subfamily A-like protein 1